MYLKSENRFYRRYNMKISAHPAGHYLSVALLDKKSNFQQKIKERREEIINDLSDSKEVKERFKAAITEYEQEWKE